MEDRVGSRPILVTSQLPIEHWHELVGDAPVGDAILDRLVLGVVRSAQGPAPSADQCGEVGAALG